MKDITQMKSPKHPLIVVGIMLLIIFCIGVGVLTSLIFWLNKLIG